MYVHYYVCMCSCVCVLCAHTVSVCHKAFLKVAATFHIWKICEMRAIKIPTESIEVAQRDDLCLPNNHVQLYFYHSFNHSFDSSFFLSLFIETTFYRVSPAKKDKKVTWVNRQSMFSKPLRYIFI